jgi:PAS domain S-box-containing protein
LITAAAERERLAELNLLAGRRATAATAFAMALAHFSAGEAMLAEDRWEQHYALSFALALHRAECEFVTGEQAAAKTRLAELADHAASLPDLAAVTRLQMEPEDRDIDIALAYLRRVGIVWSACPAPEEVSGEYERMWRQIGDRPIEALLDLPRMADPVASGTMDVLTVLVSPAWYICDNLRSLIIGRMANLSLEYGNSDASCLAYIVLGTVLGPDFDDYAAGYRFTQLGLDLVERHASDRFKARVYLGFGNWTRRVRTGRPLLRRAFEAAQQVGDFNYASFCRHHLVTHLLACSDPLAEVQREAEAGLAFARQARVDLAVDRITGQLQLIRTLRGLTQRFGCFDDGSFNEEEFEHRLEADPHLVHAAYWYWICKLQARVLADDPAATAVAAKAERLLWTSRALFLRVEFHFYAALAQAALGDAPPAGERALHLKALAANHRQLQHWADICPEDFADRAAIVGAEIARIEKRELDAMRLYDQAIGAARSSGFVHNEAIANELAGRFYAARGFDKIAYVYLRDARYGYLRWGADAKVRQLEGLYPRLHVVDDAGAVGKASNPIQQMDVTTVVKASQAVSTEIELPSLIETLMKIALQNAGADRGLLILSRHNDFWIEAEGQSNGDKFTVAMCHAPISGPNCPEALLRYAIRTQKTRIIDDASEPDPLCDQDYVYRRHPRSVLCLPLIKQARLVGLLYLENTLATHAFTPDRIAVLELLAAQAAISLENTLLYRDLWEREARIRRLVDSNIIGILFWDAQGNISYANDAFLTMTGYSRQELVSGAVGWKDMTPAEHQIDDAQRVDQLRLSGQLPPREKEFFRKDGSRVPVLIGSALLAGSPDESISFVLDLTERKQAEAEARESERRYQEMQLELAHANRLATMGQLTSSIAHEVSQPISAVAMNASAALRWLDRKPPDVEKAQFSMEQIVQDANRSSEVIGRMRELFKKAPPRKERLDLNEVVREVIVLASSEALKNGISTKMQLTDGLSLIEGDRVQLQQVLLNLVVNAIQAMATVADGPRDLLISTARTESDVVLVRVADSGPGLDPQTLEHLFDPYYTTKPDGLGMGLAICRSIIDAHNGRVWASANQPRGAVFQFTLPADPGASELTAPA